MITRPHFLIEIVGPSYIDHNYLLGIGVLSSILSVAPYRLQDMYRYCMKTDVPNAVPLSLFTYLLSFIINFNDSSLAVRTM